MAKTDSTMLALKTPLINFNLPNFNVNLKENINFLKDYPDSKAYVIAFWCNHCPYVMHVEDTFIKIANQYLKKEICFVVINSNDITTHPEDAPEKMLSKSKEKNYPFPYLYDADQQVAKNYHAACTPDFFVFNAEKKLFYRGQIDDSRPENGIALSGKDLKFSLDCLLEKKAYPKNEKQKPSMGCNIKWKHGNEPNYY